MENLLGSLGAPISRSAPVPLLSALIRSALLFRNPPRNLTFPLSASQPPCYSFLREFVSRHFEARLSPDVVYFHDDVHYDYYDYGRFRRG